MMGDPSRAKLTRRSSVQWDHSVWSLRVQMHAADPEVPPAPTRGAGADQWRWDHQRGDRRWSMSVIDTADREATDSAAELEAWVIPQRESGDRDALPPSASWWG